MRKEAKMWLSYTLSTGGHVYINNERLEQLLKKWSLSMYE